MRSLNTSCKRWGKFFWSKESLDDNQMSNNSKDDAHFKIFFMQKKQKENTRPI